MGAVILIFLLFVLPIILLGNKNKTCNKCGGDNTSELPYGTGTYCNDCYKRID